MCNIIKETVSDTDLKFSIVPLCNNVKSLQTTALSDREQSLELLQNFFVLSSPLHNNMNIDLHDQDHSCSRTIQQDFHRLCLTWPIQFFAMDLKVGVAVSHRCILAHSNLMRLSVVAFC